MSHDQQLRPHPPRRAWDEAAVAFDEAPDHGLRDPAVRAAWVRLLRRWLPSAPASVLDAGCGTGSLSVEMAALGHAVTGIDFSPAMLAHADAKARVAGRHVAWAVMDAAAPALAPGRLGAVVCRHVFWALPDPAAVLRRWVDLLRPGGRLVLVEGFWWTQAGLRAADVVALLPPELSGIAVEDLSTESAYWGDAVTDERYAIVADRQARA